MRASTNGLIRNTRRAAMALLALAVTGLLPTPAVPFATADAVVETGPDAGQPAAETLAVEAVLRVTVPADDPSIRGADPSAGQ